MRVCRRLVASLLWCAVALAVASVATVAFGQASYTAQVRGVVKDQSGAMITDATIVITNDATGISTTAHSDEHGLYILTGLRPAVYTIRADRPGFRPAEQKNVVLQVDQQTSIDFELHPLGVSTTVEVTEAAPLLDTESASDRHGRHERICARYPALRPQPVRAGVSGRRGDGDHGFGSDGYPAGTNFVSNGQRNATAQITLDGSPLSAPEQGEGGNSNVYYQPSVEIVQEFKVQNNSFSAEYGNNGGTVVNMVLKARDERSSTAAAGGTGSVRNSDARDFFNSGRQARSCARSIWLLRLAARSLRTRLSSLSISKKSPTIR